MKKLLTLCLTAVLCLCCFSSCSLSPGIGRFIPNEQITNVEIKTTNYETGIDEITEKYILTDEQSDEIKSLLNEITYVKRYNILKEKWTYFNDVKYIFTFETQKVVLSENHIYIYDSNDTLIKHVEFNSSTFNDYLEQINEVLQSNDETCEHIWDDGVEVEGGSDAYLMEYTCTVCGKKDQQIITIIPPNNDILYVSSYPQDFEYNGKHYHLVQGDELKTTATQKEVGGLLGYIIREEDVSAFTQEYSGFDYVIDNSIYDYYEGNRVAFYSLKAYPDLSIICMRKLGDYVLFQSDGENDLQFEIRDRAKDENLPCDDALEKFYEDESNEYYFSAIKSQYVVVIYDDGATENIVSALNAGRITIADLDKFGIEYHINPKQ